MKTMTLSLSDALATQVAQDAAFLGYEDASVYVSDVLGAQHEQERETLKELLLEGLNSGSPIPATPAFWTDLRAEIDALLMEHEQELNKASAA